MQSLPALNQVEPPKALAAHGAQASGPGRILLGVFETFERAGIEYCVLHGYDSYPQRIKSDVDCMISADVLPGQLVALLHQHRRHLGAEVIRARDYCLVLAGKNADGSPCFLALDLSVDHELGDRRFHSGREVLASRRRHKQFWVPAAAMEFGCYLVRKIVKGHLDDDQGRKLSNLYHQDSDGCRQQVARFWGTASAARLVAATSSGDWEPVRRILGPLSAEARRRATRRPPLSAFANWLCRLGRRARRGCWPDSGLDIVFLGPDGAGKSSVVQAVGRAWAGAFARTTCYAFPPALLGRLLRRPMRPDTMPHASAPRSFLSSMIRAVAYWFVYYTFGYLVTIHLALARSTLVLHDRHLVDALVDPRRYRYGGPLWLLRPLWRLIPKPDLVILLDAPAEVLQRRKQEVPFAETTRQREAYRALVGTMRNGHVVDAAQPQEQVANDVHDIILRHLTRRFARRFGLEQEG
jgi:thymidylate kinase